MEFEEKNKLLEDIFNKQKYYEFISQLKLPYAILNIMDVLKEIEEEDYTLEQWSNFLFYVVGKKFKVENYSSIKSYLRHYELLYLCKTKVL